MAYKKITNIWEYGFSAPGEGLYAIHIFASCKAGKILGLWGGEDLKVEIDDLKLGDFNTPSALRANLLR